MCLQTEYDAWHSGYHQLNSEYDDTSSPWYQWAARQMNTQQELAGLSGASVRNKWPSNRRKFNP